MNNLGIYLENLKLDVKYSGQTAIDINKYDKGYIFK